MGLGFSLSKQTQRMGSVQQGARRACTKASQHAMTLIFCNEDFSNDCLKMRSCTRSVQEENHVLCIAMCIYSFDIKWVRLCGCVSTVCDHWTSQLASWRTAVFAELKMNYRMCGIKKYKIWRLILTLSSCALLHNPRSVTTKYIMVQYDLFIFFRDWHVSAYLCVYKIFTIVTI